MLLIRTWFESATPHPNRGTLPQPNVSGSRFHVQQHGSLLLLLQVSSKLLHDDDVDDDDDDDDGFDTFLPSQELWLTWSLSFK